VPVGLAGPLPVVVLPHAVEFIGVGNTIGVDADGVSGHLDVTAVREDGAVVQRQVLSNDGVEANWGCQLRPVTQES